MADFKLLGDPSLEVASELGVMTQGLGYPLRSVDNVAVASQADGFPSKSLELFTFSTSIQQPVALDTPIQVAFGAPQTNDFMTLDASGTVTFLPGSEGHWNFLLFAAVEKGSNANASLTFILPLKNGSAAANPAAIRLTQQNVTIPLQFNFDDDVVAGDTYQVFMYNDSTGVNDAGLASRTSALWGQSASASLRVFRFRNVY